MSKGEEENVVNPNSIETGISSQAPVISKMTQPRNAQKKKSTTRKRGKTGQKIEKKVNPKFPRNTIKEVLRIPQAIVDQNAGKECTDAESARLVGVGFNGDFGVQISSAIKFGLLSRPSPGKIVPTELSRKILLPQSEGDVVSAYRQAILNAPEISEVYNHFRGENLPDDQFLDNILSETFKIPREKHTEFKRVLLDSLKTAQLIEEKGGKKRVLHINNTVSEVPLAASSELDRLAKSVKVNDADSCFVMMPFAPPLGDYYKLIYEPAIVKAGLKPVRADSDIFGTGKIMDQIWSGIKNSKVLIAELTDRNPNVFYELGLAHALEKPVVLVSSNDADVPFDLHHIRVIYYDVRDPFWGEKLIEKVAENVLSALGNPGEAVLASIIDASRK